MAETEFQKAVFRSLGSIKRGYKIDVEVPVPYQHVYLRKDEETILQIWCFKQDIAIYKPLFDNSVPKKVAEIIPSDKSKIQIELERGGAKREKDVALPYVIIETKDKQPIVHEVLTYSRKAEMIKTIFPYCKYVFCIYKKIDPRTYRHGIAFDEIIKITNIRNKKEIQSFKRVIIKLIKKAEQDLKSISPNKERTKG